MSTRDYEEYNARKQLGDRPSPLKDEDTIEFPDIVVSEGEDAEDSMRRFMNDEDRELLRQMYEGDDK